MANSKLLCDQRIYLDCRLLLDAVLDVTPGFPRAYKYTVGSRMHDTAVNLVSHVSAAYLAHDPEVRMRRLSDLQAEFEVMKTLVRIAGERKWIAGRSRHADIIELEDRIGRQVSAWMRSLARPASRQG